MTRLVCFTFLFCLHLAGLVRWLKSIFNCWEGGTKLVVHKNGDWSWLVRGEWSGAESK